MGDSLKIIKDKRHRSSSSIAGTGIEGTRSERKLEIKASIPEVDDQFAIAEAKCSILQEKIDLVKIFKKKKKLTKRSMTRVAEQSVVETTPFIKVVTQPKKKVSLQAARHHRVEQIPTASCSHHDSEEQHHMLSVLQGYGRQYKDNTKMSSMSTSTRTSKPRTRKTKGDSYRTVQLPERDLQASGEGRADAACSNEDFGASFNEQTSELSPRSFTKKSSDSKSQIKSVSKRKRFLIKKTSKSEVDHVKEERSVVELFNKSRSPILQDEGRPKTGQDKRSRRMYNNNAKVSGRSENVKKSENHSTGPLGDYNSESHLNPGHSKVQVRRRYEQPTIASQMKQTGVRQYAETDHQTNIPFVGTKSTAPSHNIGLNIQQLLNSLKIQQPLSRIPLSMAHHMGLGIPERKTRSNQNNSTFQMNSIKVGRKVTSLPYNKFTSYNRILSMFRKGDGKVSRFLRAINRPHYFYTSMYNLATRLDDQDAATSKGNGGSQEAKQRLVEFTSLYRQYEETEEHLKEDTQNPELMRRRDELRAELIARDEEIQQIQKLVQGAGPLHASASTADETHRYPDPKYSLW